MASCDDTHVWEQYAYRPKERHDAGKRKDEWLATATTEAGCLAEMARCLREIREGRAVAGVACGRGCDERRIRDASQAGNP